MTSDQLSKLTQIVDRPDAFVVDEGQLERLSKDFYWYSPILKPLLEDKRAEVIFQPKTVEEISAVLRFCFAEEIPVTPRGTGTGNYGQAIPLCGGVVVDFAGLDQIIEITAEGVAVCEPGVRLGHIEAEARKVGWELRCFPSTYVKASVGGFVAGGSGGIGSITYGPLRANETVRAVEILTMEPAARRLRFTGPEVHQILHSWGTNGVITRVELALGKARPWAQLVGAFDDFYAAYYFCEQLANDGEIPKRLITIFESPIASYFTPVKKFCPSNKCIAFLILDDSALAEIGQRIEASGAQVTLSQPYSEPRRGPSLIDYTWNHTTLWAIKSDPALTYLQCGFDPARATEQFRLLKQHFGDEFLFHIEIVKDENGRVVPGSLPIVRFTNEARLNEMIELCRSNGVSVSNPHVNFVEGGGRYQSDNIQLQAKYRHDPRGLLNPGKMISFQAPVTA